MKTKDKKLINEKEYEKIEKELDSWIKPELQIKKMELKIAEELYEVLDEKEEYELKLKNFRELLLKFYENVNTKKAVNLRKKLEKMTNIYEIMDSKGFIKSIKVFDPKIDEVDSRFEGENIYSPILIDAFNDVKRFVLESKKLNVILKTRKSAGKGALKNIKGLSPDIESLRESKEAYDLMTTAVFNLLIKDKNRAKMYMKMFIDERKPITNMMRTDDLIIMRDNAKTMVRKTEAVLKDRGVNSVAK